MNRATAFAGIWLLLAIPQTARPKCTFPGTVNACRSPNGQWILHWQETKEKESSRHVLVEERNAIPGTFIKVLPFNRSVDVLWSPQSTYFAVTDHTGSSDSTLFVVEPVSLPVFNVEDDFKRTLQGQQRFYANGHRYFNALHWRTASTLVFEVRAYDAEPGKEARGTFIFDVKSRTIKQTN
jgi:hypothetical protein